MAPASISITTAEGVFVYGGTRPDGSPVPAEAARSNATGRKCRAEYAEVLEISGNAECAISGHGGRYVVGETIRPDTWDPDRWNECSHGIHFFLTREEAVAWPM